MIHETIKAANAVINPSFTKSIISSSVSSLKYVLYTNTRNEFVATKDAIPKNPCRPESDTTTRQVTEPDQTLIPKKPHTMPMMMAAI